MPAKTVKSAIEESHAALDAILKGDKSGYQSSGSNPSSSGSGFGDKSSSGSGSSRTDRVGDENVDEFAPIVAKLAST